MPTLPGKGRAVLLLLAFRLQQAVRMKLPGLLVLRELSHGTAAMEYKAIPKGPQSHTCDVGKWLQVGACCTKDVHQLHRVEHCLPESTSETAWRSLDVSTGGTPAFTPQMYRGRWSCNMVVILYQASQHRHSSLQHQPLFIR